MLSSLSSIYNHKCKKGVLKTFLSLGSQLTEIPKGQKGRRAEGAVYQRCLEVDITEFSDALVAKLYKGLLTCLQRKAFTHFNIVLTDSQEEAELKGIYCVLKFS